MKLLTLAALFAFSYAQAAGIDEVYPSCSPTGITEACKPGSGSFGALPGTYTLALTIGSKTFQDQLHVSFVTRHPGMLNFAEVVAGSFTSPEAKLYSPIINGKIALSKVPTTSLFTGFEMTFEIRVTENGLKFPVYFYVAGEAANFCSAQGTAYLDAARTQVMGTFVMTKDSKTDCKCGL